MDGELEHNPSHSFLYNIGNVIHIKKVCLLFVYTCEPFGGGPADDAQKLDEETNKWKKDEKRNREIILSRSRGTKVLIPKGRVREVVDKMASRATEFIFRFFARPPRMIGRDITKQLWSGMPEGSKGEMDDPGLKRKGTPGRQWS